MSELSEYQRGVDDAFEWVLRETLKLRDAASEPNVVDAFSKAFDVVRRLRAEMRVLDLKKSA